ncbi:MAG TPA: PAS domain-containing sensor histidine kinase [Oscillatoriaceae cyanobacterium]
MPTARVSRVIHWYLTLLPPAIVAVCLLSIVGWLLDIPLLRTVVPGALPMMPGTAVGLILLSIALWLLRTERPSRRARVVAAGAAGLALAIGALMLLEYLTGRPVPWASEAMQHFSSSSGWHYGRLSLRGSLCLVLLGAALIQVASSGRGHPRVIQTLALAATFIPYVALIGYAYETKTLYEFTPSTGMALHASVAFLLLGIGVLAIRPNQGFVEAATGPGAGGHLVRELLVPFVFGQLVLGWLILAGVDLGAYDLRFAAALIAASNSVIFGALTAWTARALNREERMREAAEAEAGRSQRLLQQVVANAPVVLFATDHEGRIMLVEGNVRNRIHPLGLDSRGKSLYAIFHRYPRVIAGFEMALRGQRHRETFLLGEEAFEVWFQPVEAMNGGRAGVTGVIAVATDVTERERAEEALKRQNAQINAILDATSEGILLVDENRRVQRVNRRFLRMWGWSADEVVGHDDRELLKAATPLLCSPETLRGAFADSIREPENHDWDEIEFKDGRVFEYYSGTPVAPDGKTYGRAWFYRDVTARKKLERSLQEQNDQLKALDSLKNDFVNAVSHDLRTPLTSIRGFAEFLEDGIGGPLNTMQLGFVRELQKATNRLEGLVSGLLDFARLQAGTFRLNPETVDLKQLVGEILASFMPQAEAAGVQLKLAPETASATLLLDAPRIQQVLSNLLSNAIKFTPSGGTVSVSIRREGDGARVEVADTGVGIAAMDIPRLFQRFSQLDAGMKRGGTGLGLWISRSIVEAHGGEISVRSRPGAGSTFWFTLPAAPPTR